MGGAGVIFLAFALLCFCRQKRARKITWQDPVEELGIEEATEPVDGIFPPIDDQKKVTASDEVSLAGSTITPNSFVEDDIEVIDAKSVTSKVADEDASECPEV